MKRIIVFFFLMLCLSCKIEKSKTIVENKEPSKIVLHQIEDITLAGGSMYGVDNFPSKYITARNVVIWVPESYSENKKYAVLYMHDGQMLFDASKTWNKQEWMVDEIATELMKAGVVKDFLVVAPWNISEIRHSDYFPQKPFESLPEKVKDSIFEDAKKNDLSLISLNSDNYLKFITKELKPFVDENFSTYTNKENTVVMGSSMGGLISMYAICEYPEIFGSAACLSTHWIGTFTNKNNPIPEAFFSYMAKNLPDPNTHNIYFDYGTQTLDAMYLPYQEQVNEVLRTRGYTKDNFVNLKFDGADHSENSWQKRLDIPMTFLLKK